MVTIEQLRGEGRSGDDPVLAGVYEDNRAFLDELGDLVVNSNIVPFIGAGYSACSYAGWGALLRKIARRFPNCKDELEDLLNKGKYEAAATVVQKETGGTGKHRQDAFLREMEREFGRRGVADAFEKMSEQRKSISRAFKGNILTTNFDFLIEEAFSSCGHELSVVAPRSVYARGRIHAALHAGSPTLFKLHGDLDDRENIVLTEEDYNKAYGENNVGTELVEFLSQVFTNKQILFLGCSLETDRTVALLNRCADDCIYYALVGLPKETKNSSDSFSPMLANKVASGEYEEVKAFRDRRQYLARMNIRCIWYPADEHTALDALLGWLEDKVIKSFGGDPGEHQLPEIPLSEYGVKGREAEVKEIVGFLSGEPSVTIVSGAGGIGKTEVCREALRKIKRDGREVVYVETESKITAWAQCDSLASALGVPRLAHNEGTKTIEYVDYLNHALSRLKRPVVYLDNWEDAWNAADRSELTRNDLLDLLKGLLHGKASVLLSSREKARNLGFPVCRRSISNLGKSGSTELFDEVLRRESGENCQLDSKDLARVKLINDLEGYPLAIVLAGSLAAAAPSWADVLSGWKSASRGLGDKHDSLSKALRMSWNAVANTPYAHELWGVMALTPGDIHEAELDSLAEFSGTTRQSWAVAFERLSDASLISVADGRLTMLRPVREAFGEYARKDTELLKRCVDIVRNHLSDIFEADKTFSGETHAVALEMLPRALYLLEKMLSLYGVNEDTQQFTRELKNHFQFDWAASAPVLAKLLRRSGFGQGMEKRQRKRVKGKPVDDKFVALVLRLRAECYTHLGSLEKAEDLLCKSLELHKKVGSKQGRANDLSALAATSLRMGKLDKAEKRVKKAEKLHRECEDMRGRANDLNTHARLMRRRGKLGDALSKLTEATSLYKSVGYILGEADCHKEKASILRRQGHFDGSESYLERAKELYEIAGKGSGEADVLRSLSNIERIRGNLSKAEEYLDEAEEVRRRSGSLLGIGGDHVARAKIAMRRGNLNEAEDHLNKAREAHKRANNPLEIANDLDGLAGIARQRGQFQEAKDYLEDAEQRHRQCGDDLGLADNLNDQAKVILAEIEAAEAEGRDVDLDALLLSARNMLSDAADLSAGIENPLSAANILDAQAEVERRRGNTDVARGLAKRAKRKHDKLKDSLGSANSTYIRAWIEYDGGDVKMASSLLDVAENEYVRLGIKLELTNVRGLRLKIDAAFNPPTP